MDPRRLSEWQGIFRDFLIVLLAAFIAVFAVVKISDPTRLGVALGFSATLLGAPAFIRLDSARRSGGNGNGNGNGKDERWSHLP